MCLCCRSMLGYLLETSYKISMQNCLWSPVHFISFHCWIAGRKVRRLNCTRARISHPSPACISNFDMWGFKLFSLDSWCSILGLHIMHMLWWIMIRMCHCSWVQMFWTNILPVYHENGGSLFLKLVHNGLYRVINRCHVQTVENASFDVQTFLFILLK
jgi:hypothetical protein